MKTPTLIVRLVGLHVFLTALLGLMEIQVATASGSMWESTGGIFGDLRITLGLGLLVGLAATVFAGRIARLLTFDSGREPE